MHVCADFHAGPSKEYLIFFLLNIYKWTATKLNRIFAYGLRKIEYVEYVTAKAKNMLNLLYRSCKDISDLSIEKLHYITWVRSRLEYVSVVWSPHTKKNIFVGQLSLLLNVIYPVTTSD